MDLTAFSTISSALGILAPLCTVALFLWVIWRTRSRHSLLYRLWQLVHGNQEISDPEVRAFISEQNSLMSFRFITGVPVSTLENARHLIQWTKHHSVEMFELSRAAEYFDPDLRQIRADKLPSKLTQRMKLLLVAVSTLGIFFSGIGVYNDQAILKFKESGRWFFAATDQAQILWPRGLNALQKDNCSTDVKTNAVRTTFQEKEVQVLCKLFNEDGTQSFIKKTVREQRQAFGFLIFAMVWLLWSSLGAWMSGYVATRLARRKLDPDIEGGQLILNLDARRISTPNV